MKFSLSILLEPLIKLMISAILRTQEASAFCVTRRIFMLLSVALILIVGMSLGWLCRKVKLPALLGMLITGIVLGPYAWCVSVPSWNKS